MRVCVIVQLPRPHRWGWGDRDMLFGSTPSSPMRSIQCTYRHTALLSPAHLRGRACVPGVVVEVLQAALHAGPRDAVGRGDLMIADDSIAVSRSGPGQRRGRRVRVFAAASLSHDSCVCCIPSSS